MWLLPLAGISPYKPKVKGLLLAVPIVRTMLRVPDVMLAGSLMLI